jgi:hypothetical protein
MSASHESPTSPPESQGRRQFLQATSATLAGLALMPRGLFAGTASGNDAETVIGELYNSLSEAQKKTICFGIKDPVRVRVNANWHVTKPLIGSDFYNDKQQAMIDEIVRRVTSEEGHKKLMQQLDEDDGGIGAYSLAIFGNPSRGESGKDPFECLITGRHLTLRADGNSIENMAFGGPIVYGHGEESSAEDNLFYHQTVQVNKVFAALDSKQAEKALLKDAPSETSVQVQGKSGSFPGLAVGEMTADQKVVVKETLQKLLSPYRDQDSSEVMAIIAATGGLEQLRFAFYQQGDLGSDRMWDIWRIEGPAFVCHFRGAPHVHAYLHVAGPSQIG